MRRVGREGVVLCRRHAHVRQVRRVTCDRSRERRQIERLHFYRVVAEASLGVERSRRLRLGAVVVVDRRVVHLPLVVNVTTCPVREVVPVVGAVTVAVSAVGKGRLVARGGRYWG